MRFFRTATAAVLAALLVTSAAHAGGGTPLVWYMHASPSVISPNGDGVAESATVSVRTVGLTADYTGLVLDVVDGKGQRLATMPIGNDGDTDPNTYFANVTGSGLADGSYQLQVRDKTTNAVLTASAFKVDRQLVLAKGLSADRDVFAGNTMLRANFQQSTTWRLRILGPTGVAVRTYQGVGSLLDVIWDGTDDDGNPLPNAVYTCALFTTDPNGTERTTYGPMLWIDRSVNLVYINIDRKVIAPGSGVAETATISMKVGEPVAYTFTLFGPDGSKVRTTTGTADEKAPLNITFGLQDVRSTGTYKYRLDLIDGLGNKGSGNGDFRVDLEPPSINLGKVPPVTFKDVLTVPLQVTDPNGVSSVSMQRDGDGGPLTLQVDPGAPYLALPVAPGTQTFTFTATDSVGNKQTAAYTVTRLLVPHFGVYLRGKHIESDVDPEIVADRTMVPLRAAAQALGFDITWDGATRSVLMSGGGKTVLMQIGSPVASVNGTPVTMEAAPYIKDGRTMVPVRFVSEGLGHTVTWDPETQSVLID